MDDTAVPVAEDLDLDMARIGDEFFDEHPVVAERGFGLGAGARKTLRDLVAAVCDPHALAAAAGRGLDHHRIADLVGDPQRLGFVGDRAEMAGHGRHLGLGGELLRLDLVAHGGDGGRVRPNEDDAGSRQRLRKFRTLREEAITGMHGFRPGRAASLDDLVDDK